MELKKEKLSDKEQKNRVNPYNGLQPYEETDADAFYGRDEDKEKLFQLVRQNRLTVVIGKSGIGKSSLLNAGVFPKLREESYLPIRLQLNYAKGKHRPGLPEQIRQTIKKELEKNKIQVKATDNDKQVEAFSKNETLWEYFHSVNHFATSKNDRIIPVLVFDQFEEIFTIGKNHPDRGKLIDELYWLIEDQIPAPLKDQVLSAKKKNKRGEVPPFLSSRADCRVVISLREDYLPQLTDLKERIASIDRVMFRVTFLNGEQAREIIGMPGGFQDQVTIDNILRAFYPDEAKYDEEIPDERLEVEPVLLSLICSEVYDKRETLKSFTKKDRDEIFVDFFDSEMKKCPNRMEVEEFIEDNLLTKGGKFRRSYPLEPDQSLKDSLLYLINRRILRKDYVGNKENIEIIHDVLAPIIAEKRDKRLAKEKRKEIWGRTFRKFIYSAAVLLLLISSYAIYQTFRANTQYKSARVNWLTAEALLEGPIDNTRSVRIAGESFKNGLPHPPARTYQVLSEIGYSSYERPFYSAVLDHDDSIYTAVFSPDGKYILTAGEAGKAKLWDIGGNLLNGKIRHEGRIMSIVFSPSSKYILTTSWDNNAALWSLDGNRLKEFNHNGPVTISTFSSDGSLILTASRDGTAKLWGLDSDKAKAVFYHDLAVSSAVFSANDKIVLTASWDKRAKLWDLKGNLHREFLHDGAVESAVFSPDGKQILTASWDKTAKLWNPDGRHVIEFKHDEAVTSAVFSSDGNKILSVSRDKIVRVWDLKGNILHNLEHDEAVLSARFSNDSRSILTVSQDRTVRLWNEKGELLSELKHNDKINSAVFARDGQWILTASEAGIARLWSLNNKIITDLEHTKEVKKAVFSPDGSKILTASNDGTAKLWNGKKSIDMEHDSILSTAVFSNDGSRILTASMDNKATLWDREGKRIKNLTHSGAVSSAVFSQNSKFILTLSLDGSAKLWDGKGSYLGRVNSAGTVSSAMFSPDSTHIITTSDNGTPKIWDQKRELFFDLKNDASASFAVLSPDGQSILTISEDGTSRLWSQEKKLLAHLEHNGPISVALFSADNRFILTGSEDGTAKLWTRSGKFLEKMKHEGSVTSVVFSQDNTSILTASKDATAKLWNLDGELLATLNKHKDVVNFAVFSPDGRKILTASDDGTAKVWLTPNGIYEWLKTAKIPPLSEKDKIRLGID